MKLYTLMLSFAPARIIEPSLENLFLKSPYPTQLVITDNHYPLNRVANRKELVRLSIKYGALLFDSGADIGAAQSFNQVTDHLPLNDGDFILGYDPDSWAIEPGFDGAMVSVLQKYPDLAYVSLANDDVTFKANDIQWEDRGDVKIPLNRPEMNNITLFRWSWLKHIGGLRQICNYYGFLENHLWKSLQETGMHMGYLPTHKEDIRLTALHDPEYIQWKAEHVGFKFEGSFGDYLIKLYRPDLLASPEG